MEKEKGLFREPKHADKLQESMENKPSSPSKDLTQVLQGHSHRITEEGSPMNKLQNAWKTTAEEWQERKNTTQDSTFSSHEKIQQKGRGESTIKKRRLDRKGDSISQALETQDQSDQVKANFPVYPSDQMESVPTPDRMKETWEDFKIEREKDLDNIKSRAQKFSDTHNSILTDHTQFSNGIKTLIEEHKYLLKDTQALNNKIDSFISDTYDNNLRSYPDLNNNKSITMSHHELYLLRTDTRSYRRDIEFYYGDLSLQAGLESLSHIKGEISRQCKIRD